MQKKLFSLLFYFFIMPYFYGNATNINYPVSNFIFDKIKDKVKNADDKNKLLEIVEDLSDFFYNKDNPKKIKQRGDDQELFCEFGDKINTKFGINKFTVNILEGSFYSIIKNLKKEKIIHSINRNLIPDSSLEKKQIEILLCLIQWKNIFKRISKKNLNVPVLNNAEINLGKRVQLNNFENNNKVFIVENKKDMGEQKIIPIKKQEKCKSKDQELEELLKITLTQRKELEKRVIKSEEANYEAFCSNFSHALTECQVKAIEEIKNDFASGQPMNRVLQGSVGYGKTEVAIRTAYIVASAGQQVVIVAPTVTLAQQHYETFRKRFLATDIMVCEISARYKSKGLLKSILSGEAKIIIGTQAVFSKKIEYQNIGYIIIDEEQRFGVKHKSTLQSQFNNAHVLFMSATPIPRTLELINQNLMTCSRLITPPVGRKNIITKYLNNDEKEIKEIIDFELNRNGQVYIIFNKIEALKKEIDKLKNMFIDNDIVIEEVHGEMARDEITEQLDKFKSNKIKVLVATSIIEVGIDNPNANTMIIYQANYFGMAQLAQLRGRIGRSDKEAYCYVVGSLEDNLTKDAQEKLEAFVDNSALGDDAKLAEINWILQGSGNLFSTEQNGKGGDWNTN